jgi:hypothetical protein
MESLNHAVPQTSSPFMSLPPRPTSLRNPGATSRSNGPLFTGQWNPRCRAARGNGQAALGCRSARTVGVQGPYMHDRVGADAP